MERSVIHVNASDSTATLRCMLYGYLPSGQESSIEWGVNGSALTNDSVYTIVNEDGDMLIQNGGPQPIPSLTSTLTVNLTLSPVTGIQKYNCFSSQVGVSAPGFQSISIVQGKLYQINPLVNLCASMHRCMCQGSVQLCEHLLICVHLYVFCLIVCVFV